MGVDADIAEIAVLDQRQRLGDAVDEGLAADEADLWIFTRALRQMLAAPNPISSR